MRPCSRTDVLAPPKSSPWPQPHRTSLIYYRYEPPKTTWPLHEHHQSTISASRFPPAQCRSDDHSSMRPPPSQPQKHASATYSTRYPCDQYPSQYHSYLTTPPFSAQLAAVCPLTPPRSPHGKPSSHSHHHNSKSLALSLHDHDGIYFTGGRSSEMVILALEEIVSM